MIKKKLFGFISLFIIAMRTFSIHPGKITLPIVTSNTIQSIGKQIWQNEASGRSDLLVFWHEKEPLPSFGIGWMHRISTYTNPTILN